MRVRVVSIGLVLLSLTGCQGWQSALDTHGPEAETLETLFWTFTGILGTVWVATMIAALFSLRRRRAAGEDPLVTRPGTDRRMAIVVSSAVALTLMIVLSLTALSYGGQRALFSHKDGAVSM